MSFLQVNHVSKSYKQVRAVQDASLTVERGEVYALVGPDGAGKTTLMRAVCGLIRIDSGTILVDGRTTHENSLAYRRRLGYMPQAFSLYPDLSVEENLSFFAAIQGVQGDTYRTRRERLYRFSMLGAFANRRAEALSGGMKQKLALSCALIHEPDLLVLDEPTTGVDPLSRRQFWEILLSLKQGGVTILVSTPYMDEAARADRVSFFSAGKIRATGSPDALIHQFDGRVFRIERMLAQEELARLSSIPGIALQRFGSDTHLYLEKNASPDLLERIGTLADVNLSDAREAEPNLEDCFIQRMHVQ